MKTGELARWLGCSQSTIKNYTNDFAAYLSVNAQGGDGARRSFDDTDARIIAHAYALRQQNAAVEDIHAELQHLQAANWRDLPLLPESSDPAGGPIELMPREAANAALTTQRASLMREIAMLQDNAEELRERLDNEIGAHSDTRLQLMDVLQQLGNARGRLESFDHERRLWSWQRTALVIALVIIAILLVLAGLTLIAT